MAISEFSVSTSNTNKWFSVETSAVGGSKKYGIYVTNASNPKYTLNNANLYPTSTSGSIAIVELYANSEGGSGSGDPNDGTAVYDGVALTNLDSASIKTGALYTNTAVYGANSNTKQAYYVYNFTNNGYADTKKMAIGGNKNRRVFAIRSWGEELNDNYNKPRIAFIGDSSALKYDGTSTGYSVGCAGATKTTSANTWVSHTAGNGTKYYSITNTTTNANVYTGITLTQYHTYRFTLHAHTEAQYDGVAICKTTNTTSFSSLSASQLLSGNTSTGKCSGKDMTTTFDYASASGGLVYIYFKSDSSTIGPINDDKSFADVMVEDLGDLRLEQDAPTAVDVTVEYENTATASASGGGGQGELQYAELFSDVRLPWGTTVPTRTEIGTTRYQARYAGNASYKPSPASNTAILQVIPKKITKPTEVLGLQYDGFVHDVINNVPDRKYATSDGGHLAIAAGNYSTTYTLTNTTNYCWDDGTTAPVTVNWKITPLTAELVWGTTSWLYDGDAHSTTCRVGNLVGSDTCTVTLSNNSIIDVGTIYVTATALSNSNYRLPAYNSDKIARLTIHPCMYVKAGGEWVPVIVIYKKVNGSWVAQTTGATIRSLFSEAGRYLGRYPGSVDGTWKNLIDG